VTLGLDSFNLNDSLAGTYKKRSRFHWQATQETLSRSAIEGRIQPVAAVITGASNGHGAAKTAPAPWRRLTSLAATRPLPLQSTPVTSERAATQATAIGMLTRSFEFIPPEDLKERWRNKRKRKKVLLRREYTHAKQIRKTHTGQTRV